MQVPLGMIVCKYVNKLQVVYLVKEHTLQTVLLLHHQKQEVIALDLSKLTQNSPCTSVVSPKAALTHYKISQTALETKTSCTC
jgi:hypothetical protein